MFWILQAADPTKLSADNSCGVVLGLLFLVMWVVVRHETGKE